MTITVDNPSLEGIRLDRYLSEIAGIATRSQIPQRVSDLRVNDDPAKLSRRLHQGDKITFVVTDEPVPHLVPQDIPLAILYEDDHVIVINKEQGMVVHPGAGNRDNTVANAVMHRIALPDTAPGGIGIRPGIVHRLDKDTSGVLIVARDIETQEFLSRQFSERKTRKQYLALVKGVPRPLQGVIDSPIRRDPSHRIRFTSIPTGASRPGKEAVTSYRTLQQYDQYALVLLSPKTGRTHQLRVHMHDLGTPILGDPLYSRRDSRFPSATLMLHAYSLEIRIPPSYSRRLFTAPVPDRFRDVLRALRYT